MPIATTALIAGGIALAGGAAKTVSSAIEKKKYKELIDNYQRQELTNPYANLKVSTMGAMLQQQNAAQNTATALYNLRQSGASNIIGGAGRVVAQNNQVNQQIAAQLDEQKNRNEYLKAQGQSQVMQMQERREIEDLAGLGTAMNVANQNMWGGISDMATGALGLAGGMDKSTSYVNPIQTNQIGMNTSMGVNQTQNLFQRPPTLGTYANPMAAMGISPLNATRINAQNYGLAATKPIGY